MAKSEPILTMTPDPRDLQKLEELFAAVPQKIPRVLRMAINRSLTTMRTRVTRIVSKQIGVKSKIIRKRLFIHRATSKELSGALTVGSRGWPYVMFDPKQTAKGVKVRMRRRMLLEHAFMARMKEGHVGVFRRRGQSRLPIDEQRTPSPARIIKDAASLMEVKAAGAEMLSKRIAAEVDRVLATGETYQVKKDVTELVAA